MAGAAAALGTKPARVFLTIGRQELAAFATAPQHHYVVRTIEPVEGLLASATLIRARGPFAVEAAAPRARRARCSGTTRPGLRSSWCRSRS